ncbi:MAG: putative flavodoxin [Acidimicrobiales bacterium]|nr:putative flavodoxin [Acidimicrobiales bacterium]
MPIETLPTAAHQIAAETWLVPTFAPDPAGGFVGAHSLVIRGAEPVIVDTGCSLVRDDWLAKAFSVVEPDDVRWVFLSHDDHDHVGNVETVLERCPNATLVVNFSIAGRLTGSLDLPLERMRFLDPGQSLQLPDRTLTAVRPPVFDSPATRGLHDSATGLLWAADAFGALVQGEIYDADDVDPALYDQSFAMFNSWNTPWLEWVDVDRFAAHVQTTLDLPLELVASAHGPVHRGPRVADAFRRTLDLAAQPAVPMPGQELLDLVLAAALTETAA